MNPPKADGHPPFPLPFDKLRAGSGQEGGGDYIPVPHRDPRPFGFAQGRLRGTAPLHSPFFHSLLMISPLQVETHR